MVYSEKQPVSFFEHLNGLKSQLAQKDVYLFLDYDGTLTPIVATPDLAVLSDEMREVVQKASELYKVSIVSGRATDDVRSKVQIDNIFYLGPLRDYPQRDYLWAGSRPQDVGRLGEKAVDAILAATTAIDRHQRRRHRGNRRRTRNSDIEGHDVEVGAIPFVRNDVGYHACAEFRVVGPQRHPPVLV